MKNGAGEAMRSTPIFIGVSSAAATERGDVAAATISSKAVTRGSHELRNGLPRESRCRCQNTRKRAEKESGRSQDRPATGLRWQARRSSAGAGPTLGRAQCHCERQARCPYGWKQRSEERRVGKEGGSG